MNEILEQKRNEQEHLLNKTEHYNNNPEIYVYIKNHYQLHLHLKHSNIVLLKKFVENCEFGTSITDHELNAISRIPIHEYEPYFNCLINLHAKKKFSQREEKK